MTNIIRSAAGLAAALVSLASLAAAQTTLTLRDNPHADRPGAPPQLAYDAPTDTIVQMNPDPLAGYMPASPTLNKARLLSPWGLYEKWTRVSEVRFEDAEGRYVGVKPDLRSVALNEHGLPDLGHPDLAAVTRGERGLSALAFANGRRDPDWARWIAGRYVVITEHEAGADLAATIGASNGQVARPRRERLEDGFVRTSWTVEAPDGLDHISVRLDGGANARRWRRLSIYHTHAYDEATGGLSPTNEQALHEAGRIWSPRYLGLFAERYDAFRFMDLFRSNNSAELPGDRSVLGREGTWLLSAVSLPYDKHPWDAARHLRGDHPAGAPVEAILRMAYEASLVAREGGRDGHVVNPQVMMPFRFQGAAVDGFLDEVAAHVAWAEANGVSYDYVKLGLYNEPWNSAPGGFREAHQHAARLPVSLRPSAEERARGGAEEGGLPGEAPWYADPADLERYGVSWDGAQKGAARRLIQVLSRAHARHPQVNWIGEYAAHTGGGATSVPWVFEGARDGAADVEAWAEDGDPWTGSTAYAVVPRDEAGRYAVGALFTYSLTSYFNTYGGPGGKLFAGMEEAEVLRRDADGTLGEAVLRRFLTLPAAPADPEADKYGYGDSLAGLRARYAEIAAAVAAEGGAVIDLYEGGDHTTDRPGWSDAVKQAAGRWRDSVHHAVLTDRVNEAVLAAGSIGVSDYALTGWDQNKDAPAPSAPWIEMGDPYDRTAPYRHLAPRWLGPLPRAGARPE